MNSKVRKLEDAIIELLNSSDVEIEVKRLIMRNVLYLVEKEADKAIVAELREQKLQEQNNAEST